MRPTTWLIEAGDKNQPAGPGGPDKLVEYTLYLEEDCPDKVVYYVFIDQSGLTPQQWIEWRGKIPQEQGGAGIWLDQIQTGYSLRGGLRGRGRTAFYPKGRGTPDPISGKILAPGSKLCPDLRSQPTGENLPVGRPDIVVRLTSSECTGCGMWSTNARYQAGALSVYIK